jgi:hypothetical protein
LLPVTRNLLHIGHNDVIAGINVRGKFGLVLATQAASDFGREATEHLVSGINHEATRASLHAIWRRKSSFETPSLYA